MKVCIAEKPSVAREIAQVIGAKDRKDGYFEGNGYAVTWTFGHFCGLYDPEDYKPIWKSWSIDNLPMLPDRFETKLVGDAGVKKQFKVIKTLFDKASVVINCGDAGQEGELIQRWVIKEAKYNGPVQRLWISSLTNEAIREGFGKLKSSDEFDKLYYAGSARAIGDWLLGMNATRLYTLKYGGYKQVLSIGRVQTPTLAMLVKRHYEIANFVSNPFWELQTTYRETTFGYVKGRLEKEEDGKLLLGQVTGHPFEITSVDRKNGKEYSPRLFDLTSLQVECNKRFGYSADDTLKVVQKLYEMKVVSYPRVDTTYLPDDQYPKIYGILQHLKSQEALVRPLLSSAIRKTKRVFDDSKVTDHHAIIPTGRETQLEGNLSIVYETITKRFIANFYPECEVANTTVLGKAAEIEFKANGREVLVPGWREVYPPNHMKETEEEEDVKELPTFVVGESGPHLPKLVTKQTQAPKPYTEATLLRAMETAGKQVDDETLRELMKTNGIGRPSTRASIIETLFRRKYTYRSRKLILPTEMGIQLIDIIQNELLKSVELTGQWEKQLREIESGNFHPVSFINNMKMMVDALVTEVRMQSAKTLAAPATPAKRNVAKTARKPSQPRQVKEVEGMECPKCSKGSIIKGNRGYGCSRWKEGCKLVLPYEYYGKKITASQYSQLLTKGYTPNIKGFVVDGKTIEGLIRFGKEYVMILEAKK